MKADQDTSLMNNRGLGPNSKLNNLMTKMGMPGTTQNIAGVRDKLEKFRGKSGDATQALNAAYKNINQKLAEVATLEDSPDLSSKQRKLLDQNKAELTREFDKLPQLAQKVKFHEDLYKRLSEQCDELEINENPTVKNLSGQIKAATEAAGVVSKSVHLAGDILGNT
jgi:predicted  nucleic acid-binding Zn-ribbon protein